MTTMKRKLVCVAIASALAFAATGAIAQAEQPQPGGKLEIGTVYPSLSALSWDTADWNWKQNHDTGQVYEQLFTADLSKSKKNGGPYPFVADAWLPSEAIAGELAESWNWTDPLTLEIKLRQGVKFPAREGVMDERELVAEDVVFTYNRQNTSPKKIATYFDHIDQVTATDKHTVVFKFKEYNAEWDYRFGWGYYSGIVPKEVADAGAGNWKNVNGSGPFRLTDFVQGNSNIYTKNPIYWGTEEISGKEYKLPLVDQIVFRTIRDEATQHSALRTGKLDILEAVRWQAVEELKKSAPDLKWNRWLSTTGEYLALRVDTKPFDDVRVRRALNMAIDKRAIVKQFYDGHAELFAYPQHPEFTDYYEPLESMPKEVQELFVYDPKKAKALLAEAGYPKGFSFTAQVCSCNPSHMEILPLMSAYLEQIGVKMEIQPLEYGAFLSGMTSKKHAPGYYMGNGHTNPTTTLRKTFMSGQTWNASVYSDESFDKRIEEMLVERDEEVRKGQIRELTREIVEKAPVIWMPTPYVYSAWWPWVKNYEGELRAGAVRPGPIYARIWIDQDLKKKLGY